MQARQHFAGAPFLGSIHVMLPAQFRLARKTGIGLFEGFDALALDALGMAQSFLAPQLGSIGILVAIERGKARQPRHLLALAFPLRFRYVHCLWSAYPPTRVGFRCGVGSYPPRHQTVIPMHPPLSRLKRIDLWLGDHMGWVIAAWTLAWLALYASCPACQPPDLPW